MDFLADEIASPSRRGSFFRFRPGCVRISPAGKILSVESFSRSRLRYHSKKIKRMKSVIPGLIDAHTHLVFAGNRAKEWGLRLQGISYQEIARRGGGIQETVRATRMAPEDTLVRLSMKRLKTFLSFGVTTLETKSGYGLDLASELKILSVISKLKRLSPVQIFSTFMGAHACPKNFESNSEYISYLIRKVLPRVSKLANFQDVFCEKGYFSEEESIRLLNAGKKWGLKPKVHAHEFGRTGGVEAACRVRAVSADHLMILNHRDIQKLKSHRVIPVILPGTSFFLGARYFAPARKLWDAGLSVAIASDFNPGTNPTLNLPLCGTLAAVHQGLNLEEVLTAQTYHAALALGLKDRGCLEAGMRADFVELDAESFEEMYYSYGTSRLGSVYICGKKV